MRPLALSLSDLGLVSPSAVHANLAPAALHEKALQRQEVQLTADGTLVARTGAYTGRSPFDKFIVRDSETENTVDWTTNQPFDPAHFDAIRTRMVDWLNGREVFIQDLWIGANPAYRMPVRFISTQAWHSLFVRNMFIRPPAGSPAQDPEFTVIHAPDFRADPARDGTRSEACVLIDFTRKLVLIGGTSYAGEAKKCLFTVMNYLMPTRGVLPMHAAASLGTSGETAVFFGLSGTGKTTLSADSSRLLIGDDEHGWSADGVFNFEGGCYAKTIRLNSKTEPEIYAAARRFGTVLENVVMNPDTRAVDFDDALLTENSRACYPLDYIPNASATGMGGRPQNLIMLTCDAYGVLPPISKLSPSQAMYHFLSGYTARVAGTERDVQEPCAVFSTGFGAPFLPRPAEVYAELLGKRIAEHKVDCWLVNTGWVGGAYGTGRRMDLPTTRALVRAALSGTLAKSAFTPDPAFGLMTPLSCPGVSPDILAPRDLWEDPAAYDAQARKLAALFAENFQRFVGKTSTEVENSGFVSAPSPAAV